MSTVIITVDGKPFNLGDGTKAKIVANITERNAIADKDRFVGLIVLVLDATADNTVPTGAATYALKSGLTNTDWEKISNSVPSTGGEGVILNITPSGSLSANRFIGVDNNYAPMTGYAYAVTTENVTGGSPTDVVVTGIAYIELGANGFYAGDEIVVGVDGKGAVNSGTDTVVALALENGNNGEVIKAKLV